MSTQSPEGLGPVAMIFLKSTRLDLGKELLRVYENSNSLR